jgi:GxxExxY protein
MNQQRDPLTEQVIGGAIEVHRATGPGLLESAYEACLAYELNLRGLCFEQQVPIPVRYKGKALDCGYRIDLLVEGRLVVELKSVSELTTIHQAQLLTYMKLARMNTGLLINFNVKRLVDGIKRFKL